LVSQHEPTEREPTPAQAESEDEQHRDPVADLRRHAAEFWSFLQHSWAAKLHGRLHAGKRVAITVAMGLCFLGAITVAMATAIVLALIGFTNGMTALLGGRAWLAQMIVGVGVLAMMAAALLILRGAILAKSRRSSVAQYEARAHEHRIRFQRDAAEAAEARLREGVSFAAGGTGGSGASSNGRRNKKRSGRLRQSERLDP
jgi:hypothetical protein